MWYLLIVLYAYCGVVAMAVSFELGKRRGSKTRTTFAGILGSSVAALIFWPYVVAEMNDEWNG